MWNSRPMVVWTVGGIREQVTSETGVVLSDPNDLDTFGDAVVDLLKDPARAHTLGAAGRRFVFENFLHDRHFRQYVGLMARLEKYFTRE